MCRIPKAFKNFKCTASDCSDNCCIGWEIDVDKNAFIKYKNVTGSFSDELRRGITFSSDGSLCFKLIDERCFFLDENNLCRIYKTLGKDALCDICREHPRFYNDYGSVSEEGFGLQCEEAVRLLFEGGGITLSDVSYEKALSPSSFEDERAAAVFDLRDRIFSFIYDETLSLGAVFKKAAAEAEHTQKSLFGGFCEADILKSDVLLRYMGDMEPVDGVWPSLVEKMLRALPALKSIRKEFTSYYAERGRQYRQIFSYLLYRHLFDAVYDGETAARTAFCINFVNMLRLYDAYIIKENGVFSKNDALNTVKYLSKQIEYSEENTELLMFV